MTPGPTIVRQVLHRAGPSLYGKTYWGAQRATFLIDEVLAALAELQRAA